MKRKSNNETAELELCDLLVMVAVVIASVSILCLEYESRRVIMNDLDDSIRRMDYHYGKRKVRISFLELIDSLSNKVFRRMFRCHKSSFRKLVRIIKSNTDPVEFKSEQWLINHNEHNNAISGEVKIACTIRMLAGASYLDLLLSYKISQCMLYDIFHQTIDWINKSFNFPLLRYIKEENTEALLDIADYFSERSEGVINGCIGALDGVAIRIRSPNSIEDDIPDPGNYYCRKGFHALNMQAICDSKKRILWLSSAIICHKHVMHH